MSNNKESNFDFKNLVDQGTGNNAIENEVNQEEYEEEEEVEG